MITNLILMGSLGLGAQTLTPYLKSSTFYPTPPDAVNFCEDYFTDFAFTATFTAYYSSPTENGFVSIDSSGVVDTINIEPASDNLKPGPILNLGTTSCLMVIDNESQVLHISFRDNIQSSETDGYDIDLPVQFNQAEVLGFVFHTLFPDNYVVTAAIKAFDTSDNKWKVLVARIVINNLGDTATHEFNTLMVGSFATIATNIKIDPVGNVFIWGYFQKNAAGSNHDNFLTKYNSFGALQYSKLFFSYAGRDDIASQLVIDDLGNLYGISSSEDNVAPYYKHISVFKIKALNGKMLWTKRFGEATEGDENMWDAAGNTIGEGIAFTGSYKTGSGGRDIRTWRLSGTGAILWTKNINLNLIPGSIEEGRSVCFDIITGDVLIAGFTLNNVFIERYNTNTGVAVWPVKLYEGVESGLVINDDMILQSNLTGDDWLLFPSENPGGGCCRVTAAFFGEHYVRSNISENKNAINLYPNPASEQFLVEGIPENVPIQIINTAGQVVNEMQSMESVLYVNISEYPTGCYLLRYKNDNTFETIPFVISR